MRKPILRHDGRGLYCEAGDFHIDPYRAVPRAVITHGHSDHARPGSQWYLCAADGVGVLRSRLGANINVQALPYGEPLRIGQATVTFFPAGHVLGSAQVRVEVDGEVWVASGDYKTEPDVTCQPFEPVTCHTFITESTFALPVYRWPTAEELTRNLTNWWARNAADGRSSIVWGYSLGKSQRVLSMLREATGVGPIIAHGSVAELNAVYRRYGIALPHTLSVAEAAKLPGKQLRRAIYLAPPQTAPINALIPKLGDFAATFASGWTLVRKARGGRGSQEAVLPVSDHADWPGLLSAVAATGATQVLVNHGFVEPLVRYLREQGVDAQPLPSTKTEAQAAYASAEDLALEKG